MTSAQKMTIGGTILDKGGEEFATLADWQAEDPGAQVTFESSEPTVVGIVVREDGLNADLSSDDVGESTITTTATRGDGTHLSGSPDTMVVTVKNAQAESLNMTVGAPEDE